MTRAGFEKISGFAGQLINSQFGEGICIPQGTVLAPDSFPFTGAHYCDTQDNQCGPGCDVDIHVDSVNVAVPNQNVANVRAQLDVDADIHISYKVTGISGSCTMKLTGNDIKVDADVAFGVNPTTGELTVNLADVRRPDLGGLSFSNCGLISGIFNAITGVLNSFLGDWIIGLLRGTINDLIQGFLPHPLGIEGLIDVGSLVSGISPGVEATLEGRFVPGGYASLVGGGMSLGLITGINSDEDTATRTPDLDSEPAFCVPPLPAPDFAAPPASLAKVERGAAGPGDDPFSLKPAEEFLGMPEPGSDLAIGVSETTLDLGGHHAVTSGAMCLGVGTSTVKQLTVGTISILVKSLGELVDNGKEPLLLALRPQKALDFSIGEGTEASPSLTIGINDMEVDFYAFLFERYVRVFSMSLTLNVGVNLEFAQQPGMPATVTPTLVGLTAANIHLEVLNNEFVRESKDQLEHLLPTIFDLALPLLANGIGPITVPSFAGFTLNDLRIQHVTTREDDFLALYASLGPSQMLRAAAAKSPALASAVAGLSRDVAAFPTQVATRARLAKVDVPAPDIVRGALMGTPGARLPSVTIDVPARDEQGRELEYSWNLDGGMWRPFRTGSPLVISDRAFAWQGKYTIEVRARAKGDYRTTDPGLVEIPVLIDSVAPTVLEKQVRVDGDTFIAPATDIVSDRADLLYAYGRPDTSEPATAWQQGSGIALDRIRGLVVDGLVAVYVKDEAGNVGVAYVAPFHGQPDHAGCSCDAGGGPSAGGLLLILATGLLLVRRRVAVVARAALRGRALPMAGVWLAASALTSLVPGCNCGGKPGDESCEIDEDCTAGCPTGMLPVCLDHTCDCAPDVPYGRIGAHSDVDVASNSDAYVSAYSLAYGDLVVARQSGAGPIPDSAWEWVDGVPDGPVIFQNSMVRGGIRAVGEDVGRYSSIQVAPDDTPMVTYFDLGQVADGPMKPARPASLKFSARYGGVWQTHVIDKGTGDGTIDPAVAGEVVGMYSSLSLRSDDGRPGVAYMAVVSSGGGVVTAEVRYATATTATPQSDADWQIYVVDTVAVPPEDPNNPDILPLASGAGLFADAARGPDQAPVVVYYDRVAGDLKMARFDAASGTFGQPEILDGQNSDVGWYPAVAVDGTGAAHVVYQSATRDDLLYMSTVDRTPQVVDNGYRLVGTTDDGLPKPEFHIVGNDSNIVLSGGGALVVYQDSTTHELLLATRNGDGEWEHATLAGAEDPFVGAYGFFASAVVSGNELVISNWVIDQPSNDTWVEILRKPLDPE